MSSLSTRKQIRDSSIDTTSQDANQIGDLVNDFINLTLYEISEPAWATKNENPHNWSWLRRKTTFATVSGTEDYVLERDVDKIAILRQISSPVRLNQVSDEDFFKFIPNPSESGFPRFYRLWGLDGVATKLAAADLIDILSSSALDNTAFSAVVIGYISGRLDTDTYTMNGTSVVAGTKTFDAREIFVAKSGVTTGSVTFRRNSNSTALVILAPQDITANFKVATLFPKPSSAITMYLEYYKYIRTLASDTDVPEFHPKWHYVVRLGTIAKIYQYLGKTSDFVAAQGMYEKAVRAMIQSDKVNPDLIETMGRRDPSQLNSGIYLERNTIAITA